MQNAKSNRWRFELRSGEQVFGEAGSMVYMSSNMTMEAKMRGGGLLKAIGRKFAGETMFLTEFSRSSLCS